MSRTAFIPALIDLLQGVYDKQDAQLTKVADACAASLQEKGMIHLFGSGHSVIPTMDAYPRYGSFVGLHPIFDPRLMWHNVLGPGGVRELLWLERTENYIKQMIQNEPINSGDVFISFSHGGTNAAAIEAAEYAKAKGCFTVGITSMQNADATPRHTRGLKLSTVVDLVIDTDVPVEDALVDAGWTRPVGGSSTIVATVIMQEIITRTAKKLAEQGVQLETFVSPTVPGASVSSNDEVFAEHARYLHQAVGRAIGV